MKQSHRFIFRKKFKLFKLFTKQNGKIRLPSFLNKIGLPTFSQIKLLPKFLSNKEKNIVKILICLILLSLGFIGLTFYLSHSETVPKNGGEYIEGIVGSPKLLNPILAQNNEVDMDLSQLLFSGLLKQEGGDLKPDLASRYEVSQDKTTYTFYLRKNLKWSDDEPLIADDIILTIENIQNSEFNSPLNKSFTGVQVKKIDDLTIQFKLSEPFAPFVSLLTFGILPSHIWTFINPANAALADFNVKSPIGSGPFKIQSLKKDSRGSIKAYSLIRNNNYYNQKPYLEKVILKFFPNYKEAVMALNNKNIDSINYLPKKSQELITNKEVKMQSLSLPQYTAIFFNANSNEFLKDKKIRQALALAIDKNLIIEKALNKQATAIYGPILPGFIGYNSNLKKIDYNVAEAEKLIKEAGWVKLLPDDYEKFLEENNKKIKIGSNETTNNALEIEQIKTEPKPQTLKQKNFEQDFFLKKNEQILNITLVTVNQTENEAVANIIKSNWQKIGAKVELKLVESSLFTKDVLAGRNYDALFYGELTAFDPDPYAFWHSSQIKPPGYNLSMYSNTKVNILLEEGRKLYDTNERAKKYIEFQELLIEDLPAIFLYNPTYPYILSSKIQGFNLKKIILPADRFNGIEKWYLKTKRDFKW